jgi:serine/threonine protein kinase
MHSPYRRAQLTFELREEIGHDGKNSKVHVAHDANLDARLVIKTLLKSELGDMSLYFDESRLLHLSEHQHVVPIRYACEDDERIYIAMPHFSNGSLRQLLDRKYLTMRELVRYSTQFLSGLHNIHSKGLIHFDVKPDNILISDRDEAVLSDFGLSRRMNYDGVAGQDRFYAKMRPPEALRGQEFDLRYDVYQVGLTLYRMANGNKCFADQFATYGGQTNFDRDRFSHDIVNEQFPDRTQFLEHVPHRVRNAIVKCMRADPDARYRSLIELLNDLAQVDGKELDWQYESGADRVRKWRKVDDGFECKLTVDEARRAHAEKRTGEGDFRRIKAYCKNGITTAEIRRFLRTDGNEA